MCVGDAPSGALLIFGHCMDILSAPPPDRKNIDIFTIMFPDLVKGMKSAYDSAKVAQDRLHAPSVDAAIIEARALRVLVDIWIQRLEIEKKGLVPINRKKRKFTDLS